MTKVPTIKISTFLSYLSEEETTAVSNPVRVLGSDANEYILKTQKAYDASTKNYVDLDCSFINEFMAYCIGEFIGLPQAQIAVADIQKEFLIENPELIFNNRFKEGAHFASEFVDNTEKNLLKDYQLLQQLGKSHLRKSWTKFFGNISNSKDVPLLIAFDFLIANKDRFAHPDNFLLVNQGNNSNYLMAIDHGHAFGSPFWNSEKQRYLYNIENMTPLEYIKWFVNEFIFYNQRNVDSKIFKLNGLGDIFKSLNQHIDISNIDNHCFQEPIERINSITLKNIDEWLAQIPETWFKDQINQKIFYRKFIMYQIQLLPHIIQYVASTSGFENFVGGTLKWNLKNTGTQ